MKILVLSDSHGNRESVLLAVENAGADCILHLGDYDRDCQVIADSCNTPLRSVRGNCDRGSKTAETCEFTVEGASVFMTHGHLYNVKTGYAQIISEGRRRGADVVLFGHTHRAYADERDGMLIINPGSCGYGQKTCAILSIEHGAVKYNIKEIDSWETVKTGSGSR